MSGARSGATEAPSAAYARYRAALGDEPLPCAFIDVDALAANARALARALEGAGKTLRVATKSLRCRDLVARIRAELGPLAKGLMTYTAAETAFLAGEGERDLLLAYPTARADDAAHLAEANVLGAHAAVVVDAREHLGVLSRAAVTRGVEVPVVLEVDVGWRPIGAILHVGVRRSPLRSPAAVVALAREVASTPGLAFEGIMAYEAQIAGVADSSVAVRALKAASMRDVARSRAAVVEALRRAGLPPRTVNGGGSGSLAACAGEGALTEVTAGSGFVDSHLFDAYASLALRPAAFFALQVVRRPAPGLVTCHGGGYVASGAAGRDRLPIPALPEGLRLLPLEGAGEVQTPLDGPGVRALELGDPVFFRHAKAGEVAEHVRDYIFVEGDRAVGRGLTYRGEGKCFLG